MLRGKLRGKADAIVELLEDLGEVPHELRDEVFAEKNFEELNRLLKLAAKSKSVEEFREKKNYFTQMPY